MANESNYQIMLDTLQKIAISAQEAIVSFCQDYGPLLKELAESGNRLVKVISILGEHQYVSWAPLDKELINEILITDNVDDVLYRYEKNNRHKLEKVLRECRKNQYLKHHRMFKQAITAYKRGDYDISVIALLSVLDGLFAIIGGNLNAQMKQNKDAFFKKITDDIEETSDEYLIFALKMTLGSAISIMVQDAKKKEPSAISRHWIMHGRSTRIKKTLDCIKIIYCIYGLILLEKIISNNR